MASVSTYRPAAKQRSSHDLPDVLTEIFRQSHSKPGNQEPLNLRYLIRSTTVKESILSFIFCAPKIEVVGVWSAFMASAREGDDVNQTDEGRNKEQQNKREATGIS